MSKKKKFSLQKTPAMTYTAATTIQRQNSNSK